MKRPPPLARHVIVTGSSGAIGAAIARELRRRHPGVCLTLVDRSEQPSHDLAGELGGPVEVEPFDLSEVDAIPELVARAREHQGPLDGLVNCAGFMDVRLFESSSWQAISALLTVDLVSPLRLLHACLPDLVEGASGFVVNVTSMAGRVPIKGCSVYGAAKAGLSVASEVMRVELSRRGVRVVTVYPGPITSALERGARAKFTPDPLARLIPNGQATTLAGRVLDAVERNSPRVVYPSFHAIGFHAIGLASRASLALGPWPVA
jgi:short-subunit dehydrogenase